MPFSFPVIRILSRCPRFITELPFFIVAISLINLSALFSCSFFSSLKFPLISLFLCLLFFHCIFNRWSFRFLGSRWIVLLSLAVFSIVDFLELSDLVVLIECKRDNYPLNNCIVRNNVVQVSKVYRICLRNAATLWTRWPN